MSKGGRKASRRSSHEKQPSSPRSRRATKRVEEDWMGMGSSRDRLLHVGDGGDD